MSIFHQRITIFRDRKDAGIQLAKRLFHYAYEHPVILALPRGGVPIGYEIASLLDSPLDIIVVRKIGMPTRPEFGIGAVAEGNVKVLNGQIMKSHEISEDEVQPFVRFEKEELNRRLMTYRGTTQPPEIKNKTVIIVDDGLATGVTAQAAIQAVKKLKPKKIIFASPVCANESVQQIKSLVDNVVCLAKPTDFKAVGMWYANFDQTSDEEVMYLLKKNRKEYHKKTDRKYYQTS